MWWGCHLVGRVLAQHARGPGFTDSTEWRDNLECFSKNEKLKKRKKNQYQMTKMFYLTKFRVMHKHDSLSLSLTFQTLAI